MLSETNEDMQTRSHHNLTCTPRTRWLEAEVRPMGHSLRVGAGRERAIVVELASWSILES